MSLPPVRSIDQASTHRLVPSKYLARGDSVLTRIADDDSHLAAIFELDDATNERLGAERGRSPGIGPDELLAGVPHASIVNAAYTHAHPLGSRFSGPDRGAWYAGFALETSQAEVAFHKSVELAEIGWPDESVTYDDVLADFTADFHDLRGARGFSGCLDAASYVQSQQLAEALLDAGSLGIVYPSVRHPSGTCLACFRPALVTHVRRRGTWRFTWTRGTGPVIEGERLEPPSSRGGRLRQRSP